jgi:N-methylhydantoinase B/oxoprolinase/acetone carboxylase alpha subunit
VKILAPGGGGWGDPPARPADRVPADVAEGLVSAEGASRDHGLLVEHRNGTWGATPTPTRVAAQSTTLAGAGCGSTGPPRT